MFKFASDVQFGSGQWLYGGEKPSDELAIKAAGKELLGLECFWLSRPPGISFPLICLVDYKGYRVVGISKIPIDSKTLIYGSFILHFTSQNNFLAFFFSKLEKFHSQYLLS